MRAIRQIFWLICGVSAIAVVLGFMVGASKSPVVGVAIPAIFGLVVTVFGFIGGTTIERKLDDLKEILKEQKNARVERRLRLTEHHIKSMPNRIGKLLLIFSIFYAGGLVMGIKARIDAWFAPTQKQTQFPWANSSDLPPTMLQAADWVVVQEELLKLGYSRSQIEQFYSMQVAVWKKTKYLEEFDGVFLSQMLKGNAVTNNEYDALRSQVPRDTSLGDTEPIEDYEDEIKVPQESAKKTKNVEKKPNKKSITGDKKSKRTQSKREHKDKKKQR